MTRLLFIVPPLFLVTASCVTPLTIECSSRCGTQIITLPPEGHLPDPQGTLWTCETLQLAEDKLLPLVTEKYPRACEQLQVQIAFHPGPSWEYPKGRKVAGVAHCQFGIIELSSNVIYESAYAHEMLHVLQGCDAPAPIDENLDADHADWKRNGFLGIDSAWKSAMKEELE